MSNQLLVAMRRYEKDDGYESLITTAVGLLTQKDDDLVLLESKAPFTRREHADVSTRFGLVYTKTQFLITENDYF